MATKVLIVDDHPAVREGLAVHITSQPDLEVYGQAADTAEALKLLEAARPDVVVVDIQLETGNGLALVERIKARDESIGVLVWSMYPDAIYAQRGASGRRPGLHQQAVRDQPHRRGHSLRSRRQDLSLRRDRRAVARPDGRQRQTSQGIGSGVPFGSRVGSLSAHRPGADLLPNRSASSPQLAYGGIAPREKQA